MAQLQSVRSVGLGAPAALGWFQHVVRPLMRQPGQAQAALVDGGDGEPRQRGQGRTRRYAGRCFAGPEGVGCPLSAAEQGIAARTAHEPMSWEVC